LELFSVSGSLLASARPHFATLRARAHVPFSDRPHSVLLVLRDGRWIPGVRIESASYSLSISAIGNAVTTAYSLRCFDAVAGIVSSAPLSAADRVYLQALDGFSGAASTSNGQGATAYWRTPPPSELGTAVDPTRPVPASPEAGISAARNGATAAHVPESHFPVGAVLVHNNQIAIPGVNVEHPDWTRILCAERNALSTAYAYGYTHCTALYLSCPRAPNGSPCGACRQVLAERAPEATLYMDRHDAPMEQSTPAALLPSFFNSSDLISD
jgi:homotetrameric cytidine deaminase